MPTTFEELYKKVLLRVNKDDARAFLAVKESVNDAHKDIARAWDVDELIVLDTDSATTQADQKTYHIEDDFNLERPKDILGILLEDGANSRRLTWKPSKWVDVNIPYPEGLSSSKPEMYTRRGNNVELLNIPDDTYNLHIHHSQWPTVLSLDADETDYTDLDDVIIALATERATAVLNNETAIDWSARAKYHLGMAHREDRDRPDEIRVAQPFRTRGVVATSEFWKDPFVRRNP